MKRTILMLAAVLCVIGCHSKEPFTIGKGVNISHWLSQNDARGEARKGYFTRNDVKAIAEMGFDHIRIPIDEEQMFDADLNPEPEAFACTYCVRTISTLRRSRYSPIRRHRSGSANAGAGSRPS